MNAFVLIERRGAGTATAGDRWPHLAPGGTDDPNPDFDEFPSERELYEQGWCESYWS